MGVVPQLFLEALQKLQFLGSPLNAVKRITNNFQERSRYSRMSQRPASWLLTLCSASELLEVGAEAVVATLRASFSQQARLYRDIQVCQQNSYAHAESPLVPQLGIAA